jgi:fatty-acyl-CoA synthase
MAALVLRGELNLPSFRSHLARLLPAYARPVFLRVRPAISVTATFKHAKSGLASEGYDPSLVEDTIYFDHPAQQAFVPLDRLLYKDIADGRIRL